MHIEHLALNVPDAKGMSDWYIEHLGMVKAQGLDVAPFTHFLADATGRIILEIYTNPEAHIPDYPKTPPMTIHLAFAVSDPGVERARLEGAGASFVEEVRPADGSILIMLRDPWGLPLQLCRRGTPLFRRC